MADDVAWRVTGQTTDYQVLSSANEPVTGVLVYFRTAAGQRGSVLVPDDLYSPATVKSMIDEKAAQLDAVAGLTSETEV